MARVRLLTARGPGGLAVIEVAGPDAGARVARLAGEPLPRAGTFRVARLTSGGEVLDEAIVCARGPEHFEVHVTGSPPLAAEVLRALEREGVESQDPAESISAETISAETIEERARVRLSAAASLAAARTLLDQAEGALRGELEALPGLPAGERRRRTDVLLERGRRARFLIEPPELVLAGEVNAGKSTLFNALVGERRVITSDEEGTTRDAIRETALLGDWPVQLVDTAGERALAAEGAHAAVERAGQSLGRALRERADAVVWLAPITDQVERPDGPDGRFLVLRTFADRLSPSPEQWPAACVSAAGEPEHARRVVAALFRARFELPEAAWEPGAAVPFEEPQLAALHRLRAAQDALSREIVAELLSPR